VSESSEIEDLVFCGEFEHSIDSQGRVSIPKDWRHKDKDTRFIILPDTNYLQLYPFELFKIFLEKAKLISLADRKKAIALAKIASRAHECRCDKQGRIKIPNHLLDVAEIETQATLAGVFTKAQIWNPTNWKTEMDAIDDETSLNEILDI